LQCPAAKWAAHCHALQFIGRLLMQQIVVLNPKGGSGKTSIAVNIAGCYSTRGERLTLVRPDTRV